MILRMTVYTPEFRFRQALIRSTHFLTHTLHDVTYTEKIFVDWYTPKIRWSLKDQFICIINRGIYPFPDKKTLKGISPVANW